MNKNTVVEPADREVYDQLITSKISHERDLFSKQILFDAAISPVRSLGENYSNIPFGGYLWLT